jgi:hypothetical protein
VTICELTEGGIDELAGFAPREEVEANRTELTPSPMISTPPCAIAE